MDACSIKLTVYEIISLLSESMSRCHWRSLINSDVLWCYSKVYFMYNILSLSCYSFGWRQLVSSIVPCIAIREKQKTCVSLRKSNDGILPVSAMGQLPGQVDIPFIHPTWQSYATSLFVTISIFNILYMCLNIRYQCRQWARQLMRQVDIPFVRPACQSCAISLFVTISIFRPCLDPNFFLDFDTVALSFLFDKHYLIMEQLGLKDSSRNLQINCAIS